MTKSASPSIVRRFVSGLAQGTWCSAVKSFETSSRRCSNISTSARLSRNWILVGIIRATSGIQVLVSDERRDHPTDRVRLIELELVALPRDVDAKLNYLDFSLF